MITKTSFCNFDSTPLVLLFFVPDALIQSSAAALPTNSRETALMPKFRKIRQFDKAFSYMYDRQTKNELS
jgi:hypothetical protein